MEGKTDVFTNLKHAFELAVEYAVVNGMQESEVREIRRSELLLAVVNEASHRLKERNVPYQDGLADVITGRKKYHEPTGENVIEHDYKYLTSILSSSDIGRLEHAIEFRLPIIVTGVQGPTGKSALVKYLSQRGIYAVEDLHAEKFALNKILEKRDKTPFKLFF